MRGAAGNSRSYRDPSADESAQSEDSLPTTEPPVPTEAKTPVLGVPDVEDVPERKLESTDEPDPAASFDDEPTFDLKEQDTFGLLDFEPEKKVVPVFDLRELPSRNATNDKPDTAPPSDDPLMPVPVSKIEQTSAEFVIESPAPRILVEIPDWIDLRSVPAKKPMSCMPKPKPQAKPTLKKEPALAKKAAVPVRQSDDFQVWKSDDPFWTDTSPSRPVVNQPSEFEDYQPRFHTIK